ncbi:MAG: hypothetical protein UHS49_06210 [Faecalimonas sp.]|nr:hypothetical protein [Faecalimonas sp.]
MPEAAAYTRLKKIDEELDWKNRQIFEIEHKRNKLEIERDNLRGIAKLTKKAEMQKKIDSLEQKAKDMRKELSNILRDYGYVNAQEFYRAFYISQNAYAIYQDKCSEWEDVYGENARQGQESFSEKLERYKKQQREQEEPRWIRTRGGRAR